LRQWQQIVHRLADEAHDDVDPKSGAPARGSANRLPGERRTEDLQRVKGDHRENAEPPGAARDL